MELQEGMQTVTRESNLLQLFETTALREGEENVLTCITLEVSRISKAKWKGIAHTHCILAHKVVSPEHIGEQLSYCYTWTH